jgi:hypothetical protein
VLAAVGDEVVQREAVVAGNEIDALLGLALLMARKDPGCRRAGALTAQRRHDRLSRSCGLERGVVLALR